MNFLNLLHEAKRLIKSRTFLVVYFSTFTILISIGYNSLESWPQEQFISLSTLGSNMTAGDYYPGNKSFMTDGEYANWYVNVYNHMDKTQYLSIRMKLTNSSPAIPEDSLDYERKNTQIFQIDRALMDNSSWTAPLNFSITGIEEDINYVTIKAMRINDKNINNLDIKSLKGKPFGFRVELWRYIPEINDFVFNQSSARNETSTWNQIWMNIEKKRIFF